MPALKLGVVATAMGEPAELSEVVRRSAEAGFDGVQLPVLAPGLSLPELSRSGLREVARIVTARELAVFSLGTTTGRGEKGGLRAGADVDKILFHLDRSLRTAADLTALTGEPCVLCVDAGELPVLATAEPPKAKPVDPLLLGALVLPSPAETARLAGPATTPRPAVPSPADPAFEANVATVFGEAGNLADKYGVPLAWRSELGTLADLQAAITRAACPLFGVDLDPVAALRDGWDVSTMLERFAGGGGMGGVLHVRLRDALRGGGGRTQPAAVGEGHAGVRELLSALRDAAFAGPVVVDPTELPHRESAARQAAGVVRAAG